MQTVFKYIYMFYTFRRPHFAGSDIHFIRTQTPGALICQTARIHGSLPIAVSDGHTRRPPYFFTLAEKPSHCFYSCPKGRLKKHLMLKK